MFSHAALRPLFEASYFRNGTINKRVQKYFDCKQNQETVKDDLLLMLLELLVQPNKII